MRELETWKEMRSRLLARKWHKRLLSPYCLVETRLIFQNLYRLFTRVIALSCDYEHRR